MALYVPGTDETDPKKIIMSQQLVAGQTSTNTTDIATANTNITSNTTNIATNTSAIAALQAGPLVSGAVAAKSDEVTATSVTLATTPGRQQFHPSAAKAWAKFTGSASNGNQTIGDSFNVTSVARTALGNYTVTFTTAFTTANYCCLGSSHASGTTNGFVQFNSLATGSVNAAFINIAGPAGFDPTLGASLVFFGTE